MCIFNTCTCICISKCFLIENIFSMLQRSKRGKQTRSSMTLASCKATWIKRAWEKKIDEKTRDWVKSWQEIKRLSEIKRKIMKRKKERKSWDRGAKNKYREGRSDENTSSSLIDYDAVWWLYIHKNGRICRLKITSTIWSNGPVDGLTDGHDLLYRCVVTS